MYVLRNTDNNKEILLKYVEEEDDILSDETTALNFPTQSPSDAILLSLNGQQNDLTLSFTLYDDGSDVSNGTHTSSVVTLREQKKYLKTEIKAKTVLPVVEIEAPDGTTTQGRIRNLRLPLTSTRPNQIDGSLQFLVGGGA